MIAASSTMDVSSGDGFTAVTLRHPYCLGDESCVKAEGEWTLRFEPVFEVADTLTYHMFVVVDHATIASTFRVFQPEPGVGTPLRVIARLEEVGELQ